MKLSKKAESGFIDNKKGIGFGINKKQKDIWFTKCKAGDFQKDIFKPFTNIMLDKIKEKEKIYGNSWEKVEMNFLFERIKNKYKEFELTKNPDKLISLANLCMMFWVRCIKNGNKI